MIKTMIDTSTVLILGAGASTHLTYPDGQGLLDQVCRRISRKQYHDSINGSHDDSEIQALWKGLNFGPFYSVDAFLEHHTDLRDVGKLLMADVLKAYEMPVFSNPGWYKYLLTHLLTDSAKDIPNNRLSVITFNYDRSLEFYLHQALIHHYRDEISEEMAWQIVSKINIIHPHGILGEYPVIPYSKEVDGETLQELSSAIKIVDEIVDSKEQFCTPEFRSCHEALLAADKIYFLGFGFHEDNVRRMAFFNEETIKQREVLATSLFKTLAMKEKLAVMKKYGFSERNFQSSTCGSFFEHYGSLT